MLRQDRLDLFSGGWNETVTMPRTPVTASELVQVLNTRLAQTPGLTRCHVEEIDRLKGLDETGCNWSENVNCSGLETDEARGDLLQVIEEMRGRYNLI